MRPGGEQNFPAEHHRSHLCFYMQLLRLPPIMAGWILLSCSSWGFTPLLVRANFFAPKLVTLSWVASRVLGPCPFQKVDNRQGVTESILLTDPFVLVC